MPLTRHHDRITTRREIPARPRRNTHLLAVQKTVAPAFVLVTDIRPMEAFGGSYLALIKLVGSFARLSLRRSRATSGAFDAAFLAASAAAFLAASKAACLQRSRGLLSSCFLGSLNGSQLFSGLGGGFGGSSLLHRSGLAAASLAAFFLAASSAAFFLAASKAACLRAPVQL